MRRERTGDYRMGEHAGSPLPCCLMDSHAHLDAGQFDADREQVIARAEAAGVRYIINAGAGMESSQAGIALAEAYPGIYAAVGVHPHEARVWCEAVLSKLRVLAQHPRVVAIGEIGLDFHYNFSPREMQLQAFQEQLALARQVGKPVIIHDREAHAETVSILREWARGQKHPGGVLHCFSGDLAMAKQAVELGFLIGIAGPVTFANARKLPEIVHHLPLDKLLLETDCPYLSPHPYRGQRNEPAYVRLVAQRVAEIKSLTLVEVARVTTANVAWLFGLADDA